jgi:methionyl-tRNA formyltransferase
MNISIFITSKEHPIFSYLVEWIEKNKSNHQINLVHSVEDLSEGDILFLISCSEVVSKTVRDKFQKTLVVHASDLPHGRGWSPHIWEIVSGATSITVSLIEAEDQVDTGDIWEKLNIEIPKTVLFEEINQLIFNTEIELINFAINNFNTVSSQPQSEEGASYFSKRTPKDSEIDIDKSLSEQFDLIRVCDESRFPAFFYKDGKKFNLTIYKDDE